jgi:methionine-rich copper-binding protein CopC
MADERRQTRIDPLVEGVSDGVSHGYRALERVLEGLAQSIRAQEGAEPSGSAARTGDRPSAIDHSTQIVVELLHRAGDLAHGVAHSVSSQAPRGATQHAGTHEVVLRAAPGAKARADFKVWNTGPTVLRELTFHATDLQGGGRRIAATNVRFHPSAVKNVRQNAAADVQVEVTVPARAVAGRYHGVIEATPTDTHAVLALTVLEGGAKRAARGAAAGEKRSTRVPASKRASRARKS